MCHEPYAICRFSDLLICRFAGIMNPVNGSTTIRRLTAAAGTLAKITRTAWHRAGDGLLAIGLFATVFFVYTQTLAPSVAALFDDSLEFPLVVHRLAIAHPTGYPLYTLLGRLAVAVLGAWQNPAWAVNLLSAAAGALTVALVYLAGRELSRRRLPPLLGAVALACSPVFWSQAVVAEVYTLNSSFVAALLWLALRWSRRPISETVSGSFSAAGTAAKKGPQKSLFLPGERRKLRLPPAIGRAAQSVYAAYRHFFPAVPAGRRLRLHPLTLVIVVLFGLGLTHHRTIVLLTVPLLLFALLVERRVFSRAALLGPDHPGRPRWLQIITRPAVLLVLCLLGPLLLYLYLPLRGHVGSLDSTYANTWSGFWRWVAAGDYGAFLGDNPLARNLDGSFYGGLFWQQFGPAGLALAVVGLIGLAVRKQLKALLLTGLSFAAYVMFAVLYRVPDVEVFAIPAFLLVALWIGLGLDWAADLLRPRGPILGLRRLMAIGRVLLFLAAIVQPLAIAARNYSELDRSRDWIVHDYGSTVLELLPDNSTVVGLLGEMTLLRYLQETQGLRPDIQTVVADAEPARREKVEEALAQGRTVLLTRPLPGMEADHSLSAVIGLIDVSGDVETLVRVGQPSYDLPAIPFPAKVRPVEGLRLLGYGVQEHRTHDRAWAELSLWWRAPGGLGQRLKISARLVNADGQTVAAVDSEPVANTYPTTAWRPGEIITDVYDIPLPAGLPPGDYTPTVVVYDPATGLELGRAELAPVLLDGNPARPPRKVLESSLGRLTNALFGDVELLGLTPPHPRVEYHPGDALPLTLLWQAQQRPQGDLRLEFWLEGDRTYPVGEVPLGGRFGTDRWLDQQLLVRQWPILNVPEGIPPGTYQLKMRTLRDGQPVPWGRWLLPLGSDLEMGAIQVK